MDLITGERNHSTHAEDMFLYGPSGASFVLDIFDKMIRGSWDDLTVSTKIDGAPVVLIGSSFAGINKPFVASKSLLNNKEVPENTNYATNTDDLQRLYGDRPGLLKKMTTLLSLVPQLHIPEGECWRGDFLFDESSRVVKHYGNELLVFFHPNSLVYGVPRNTPEGQKIIESKLGIVWHTYYKGDSIANAEPHFDIDLTRIHSIKELYTISPVLTDIPEMSDDSIAQLLKTLRDIRRVSTSVEGAKFYADLVADRKFVRDIFMTFQNFLIRNNTDLSLWNFHAAFVEWIRTKYDQKIATLKTLKAQQGYETEKRKWMKAFEDHSETSIQLLAVMERIVNIKKYTLLPMLEKRAAFKAFYLSRSVGELKPTFQEGFVISMKGRADSLKLIDRYEFSRINFNEDTVNGWQQEALGFRST